MTEQELHEYYKGYESGKLDSLVTLKSVLSSMKSKPGTITAEIMNKILDEIYEKTEQELT